VLDCVLAAEQIGLPGGDGRVGFPEHAPRVYPLSIMGKP
jgi:hypothetical protein